MTKTMTSLWWKAKLQLTLGFGALIVGAVVLVTIAAIFTGSKMFLGIPLSYWLFMAILPVVLIMLVFRFNRLDLDRDRRADCSGLE